MGFIDFFFRKKHNFLKSEIERVTEVPSLKDLCSKAFPSKNGLYPHEILILFYSPKFTTDQKDFPSYWYYEYSVANVHDVLVSLKKRGFIEESNILDTLKNLKAETLKSELKLLGKKTSGKKQDLIDRLISTDLSYFENKYRQRYYRITPLGESELSENPYISYLANHKDMNIWEMNFLLNTKYKGRSYRDVIWITLSDRSRESAKKGDILAYESILYRMSDFLLEENKIEQSFNVLCGATLLRLNGAQNNIEWIQSLKTGTLNSVELDRYKTFVDGIAPYENSSIKLYPYVKNFSYFKKEFNIDDKQFIDKILKCFDKYNYSIPLRIFTNEECADIIIAEIDKNVTKLSKLYKIAQNRLNNIK